MTLANKSFWIIAVGFLFLTTLSSCIEDGFTTSSSDVLDFNMDTVAFDTVITLQGTATKQIVVYNHSPKQINISSIRVAGHATKGHFHLNVDGVRGDEFQNVEIRGNDSIFIFIEAYLDEMEKNEPTLLEDQLEFVTNGIKQYVLLSAWGQDVVRLNGDTIATNRHFTGDKPYLIYDTLFVAPNVTLTIDEGATLLFHDKAAIRCAGTMLANGTAQAPITFRGDRLDHVVGEISFDIMTGQWGGIIFTPPTTGNVLKHVIMKGSTFGMYCMSEQLDTTKCALKLVNCVLTNSASTCLVTFASYVEAIGTEFSDAAEEVVYFQGGKVQATHCTFANYYLFKVPDLPIVNLFDLELFDNTIVKIGAHFDNCILYGLSDNLTVFNAGRLVQTKDEQDREVWKVFNSQDIDNFNIFVRYCLIKGAEETGTHFINCVWDGDPCFLTVRDDYLFDYRLGNESDAIGKGNNDLCSDEARYDRYGNDRLTRGSVDLGAYVWVPVADEE